MKFEYNDNEKTLIFLSMFDLGYKKEQDLLDLFEEPKEFLSDFFTRFDEISNFISSSELVLDMKNAVQENVLNSYIKNLNEKDILILTLYSKDYPESLKNIETPPFTLFCRGDVSLLNSEGIAVVGTRTPTTYGKVITEQFCKGLVLNDFTIISGLASGVDSISHKTALENNGKTIAVMGSGHNNIYPSFNLNLSKEIEKKGLLISEYRPSFKPTLYSFPQRNRIIAGLSKGVLITEAGEKSGSLHTKEFALEMGKEVFAVPGSIQSSMSKGTNRLIRSMQGACVLNYEDIVCRFREKVVKSSSAKLSQMGIDDQLIIGLLSKEERNFEQLQSQTKLSTSKLNSTLTLLQIKGLIKQAPGNIYCLA